MVDWGTTNEEAGIEFFGRHDGGEKAANVARHQDWRTVYNSLVMCIFANVSPETQVDLINAACGLDWDVDEMMRCGERGWNLKRAINNRLGLTRANDKLPKALLEPYHEGGAAGYRDPVRGDDRSLLRRARMGLGHWSPDEGISFSPSGWEMWSKMYGDDFASMLIHTFLLHNLVTIK